MVLEEIAESYGQWDKDGVAKEGYYFKYIDTDTYERNSRTQ